MMFDHYRIPRENLLNKSGDVTPEGEYVTPYRDPNKRHGVSLGILSSGRVGICMMSNTYLCSAISVAIR